MPEHGGGLAAHQVQHRGRPAVPGEVAQPLAQRRTGGGRLAAGRLGSGDRGGGAGQVRQQAARADREERADQAVLAQVGDDHSRLRLGHRLREGGESALRVHRGHAHPRRPVVARGGGHAVAGPGTPGDGGGGATRRTAAGGDRVQGRVRRGVVGLPRAADRPGQRGEEDERVEVRQQFVEYERRLHLGPEYGCEAGRSERVEHAVVEDSGGVHHGPHVPDVSQQGAQLLAVRGVARGDGQLDAAQLGAERGHAFGFGTAAADEDEPFRAVGGEPAGHLRAEGTGAAGDEHRAGRRPRGGCVERYGGGDDSPAVRARGADGDLVLTVGAVQRLREPAQGRLVQSLREVYEATPAAGQLKPGDPAEPPDGGLSGSGRRVAVADLDGAPGDRPQWCLDARFAEEADEPGGGDGGRARVAGGAEGEERDDPVVVAGLEVGEAGHVRAEGTRHRGHRLVGLVRHDREPAAARLPAAGAGKRRPGLAVAPGVDGGAFQAAAAPGGEGGDHRADRVAVEVQRGRQRLGVAALDGRPELRVHRVDRERELGWLGPVPLVVERVGGQLGGPRSDPGEGGCPVDGDARGVQPGERREEGRLLRPVLAQGRCRAAGEGGEHPVRPDLQQRRLTEAGHRVGEADRLPHLPDPILRIRHIPAGGDRDTRRAERDPLDSGPEVVQHRIHQRRMERVRHPQPGRLDEPGRDRLHLSLDAGDDDRVRSVDGGDGDTGGEQRRDLGLGRPDSHHCPTSRQGLHESCSGGHQTARVLKGQHTSNVRRADLTDRVAREMVGPDTERLNQPVESHLDGEQCRLRPPRLIEQIRIGAPHHIPQTRVKVSQHLVQRRREDRETGVQLAAHAETLRALAGEEDAERATGSDSTGDLGDAVRRGQQHGPVVEGRASGQGQPDPAGGCLDAAQAGELAVQGGFGPGGDRPRDDRGLGGRLGGRHRRGLFQDDVRVRAADPERRHRRAARAIHLRPRHRLRQQLDRTGRPVHMRRRRVHMQRLRHEPVPHRLHHLDHTSHTGGRLGVTEVRLDRAEQQRPLPVPPVRGKQSLGFDRVAECGAGAVPLHHVHIGQRKAAAGQCLADHPLLRRPVRRGQAVRRTVLVHR
ncbi:hypothetical protein GCM10027575_79880 [Phytohabitans suffuscus]